VRAAGPAGAGKTSGGNGWADVWKMGYFAWEYKGQHADLDKAYRQLPQYRESLLNPPLLIVSDLQRIIIHTNFTNTVKHVVELTLDDLLIPDKLEILRKAFTDIRTSCAPVPRQRSWNRALKRSLNSERDPRKHPAGAAIRAVVEGHFRTGAFGAM
jgi:hypothetical protein